MNANQIIDALGGTYATAVLFKVRAQAVSQWRKKNVIPRARLMYLELLRPEFFKSKKAA